MALNAAEHTPHRHECQAFPLGPTAEKGSRPQSS